MCRHVSHSPEMGLLGVTSSCPIVQRTRQIRPGLSR
jgi:hypothetical protein